MGNYKEDITQLILVIDLKIRRRSWMIVNDIGYLSLEAPAKIGGGGGHGLSFYFYF